MNKNNPSIIKISRLRFIIGILIGLLFSITFYSFLYLIREVFRILSVTESYDLWILTDKEVHFYNLVFAFISVIIGQSIAFSFLFDRPKSISETKNYRTTTIVNDQRALNWYFLSWFSKLAIVYGVMLGLDSHTAFYVFSFYPKYNYIFILIVIVLFLQTWNTLNLTFKSKGQKWMLISAVSISIIAFGISRINLIDYKKFNQIFLEKNTYYNYNFELSETNNYKQLYWPYIEKIYLVERKTEQANYEPLILIGNKEIALEKLQEKVLELYSLRREHDIPFVACRLYIHKSIKMGFVNQVKNELIKTGASRIDYAVTPINREYDKRYYHDYSVRMALPEWQADLKEAKSVYKDLVNFKNIIEVKKSESGYLINDSLIKVNQVKDILREFIQQNSDYVIKLNVDDDLIVSDYIGVSSNIRAVINELRDEYSEKKFSKQYDFLSNDEMIEVIDKFPQAIFEMTTELKEIIESE